MAVTFDPHPLSVIRPDMAPLLLTSMAHRLEIFEAEGIGGVLVIQFTSELAPSRRRGSPPGSWLTP